MERFGSRRPGILSALARSWWHRGHGTTSRDGLPRLDESAAHQHASERDRESRATWLAGFAIASVRQGKVDERTVDEALVLADGSPEIVERARVHIETTEGLDAFTAARAEQLLIRVLRKLSGTDPSST